MVDLASNPRTTGLIEGPLPDTPELPLRLALIGATGYVGSCALQEALARGRRVTAIVRRPDRLPSHANLQARTLDIHQTAALAAALAGHDAVISCFNPGGHDTSAYPYFYRDIIEGTRSMIEATKRAGVARLVYVGGVGSLYIRPGVMVTDDPEFLNYLQNAPKGTMVPEGPPSIDIPLAVRIAFYLFERERKLDWTFISPALFLGNYGGRRGRLLFGENEVLMENGVPAKLDVQDLAAVAVDEAVRPRHSRCRFTVATAS